MLPRISRATNQATLNHGPTHANVRDSPGGRGRRAGQGRAGLGRPGGEQSLKRIEAAGERASGGLKGLGRQAELLRTGIRNLVASSTAVNTATSTAWSIFRFGWGFSTNQDFNGDIA